MRSEGEEDLKNDTHRMDCGAFRGANVQRKGKRFAGKDHELGLGHADEEWLPSGDVTGG